MASTTLLPFDAALTSDQEYDKVLTSTKLPISVPNSLAAPAVQLPVTGANPFFDSMRETKLRVHDTPINPTNDTKNITLTENGGVTLASTESPTLDLFVELGSVEDRDQIRKLLDEAWAKDALQTLKIVFQARSISRGKGKKEPFVQSCAWLAERHPQTLLRNLSILVAPTDPIPQKKAKEEEEEGKGDGLVKKEDKEDGVTVKKEEEDEDADLCDVEEPEKKEGATPRTHRAIGTYKDALDLLVLSSLPSTTTPSGTELSISGDYSRIPGLSFQPDSPYASTRSQPKKRRRTGASTAVSVNVSTDGKSIHKPDVTRLTQQLSAEGGFHRALHLTVVRMFGEQLKQDLVNLRAMTNAKEQGMDAESVVFGSRISLAAKWAPTEGQLHDRFTGVSAAIAEYLFPFDANTNRTTAGVTNCLRKYRLEYLGPLRKFLEIPERYISAGKWDEVKYSRVPSIAMSKLNKHFGKHDAAGFAAYLQRVAEGKASISGAAMTPAVLFKKAAGSGHGVPAGSMEVTVAEAQWKTLVQSIKDEGVLESCIGIADVSGSMWSPQLFDGTAPIDSSLALAILISQVTAAPFNNSIISFTDKPAFIDLPEGLSLREKRQKIEREGMGYSTNFIGAFEVILDKAKKAGLTQEQMPKRVVAFSDMEFDAAGGHHAGKYATHYEVIKNKFEKAGYEIPELVFWNLASGQKKTSKPVTADQAGTALISGYSAALIKMFLSGNVDAEEEEPQVVEEVDEETWTVVLKKVKKVMTPEGLMEKALSHEQFRELKVYD
ncbi:hypothetical protein T439DRAFT_376708 [Meredithblackwellia eburnea MCA 4105]